MKKILALVLALVLCVSVAVPAFAYYYGAWEWEDGGFRWYEYDPDGSYRFPMGAWKWIDDDGDGVAQCYYFGYDGLLYQSEWTPDGYWVNGIGEWCDPSSGMVINYSCSPYESWFGNPWD